MSRKRAVNFTKLKCKEKSCPKVSPSDAGNTKIVKASPGVFKRDTVPSTCENNEADNVECATQKQRALSSATKSKLENFALQNQETIFESSVISSDKTDAESSAASFSKGKTKQTSNQEAKYTPLQQQYLEIKSQYPDAVLFVECGYKYRFLGEDAKIASKHLNICCNVEQNMFSASIPCQRLNVHVRRLVACGHKVGVVKQMESSAVRAMGEHRNDLFERKLTALYSQATLIGQDVDGCEEPENEGGESAPYMICIYETHNRNNVNIGLVGFCPVTGDACYWSGQESTDRSGLERCLVQIQPVEFLLPATSLSQLTLTMVAHFVKKRSHAGVQVRVEHLPDKQFDYVSGLIQVSDLFRDGSQQMSQLASEVICSTAALLTYLEEFRLKGILTSSRQLVPLIQHEDTMHLSLDSITNLEIFQNSSSLKEHGSLFWALNKTKTAFGRRLLKHWLSNPSCSEKVIVERQDVIEEILHSESTVLKELHKMLLHLPDLETAICATLQLRVSCEKFYNLTHHLAQVQSAVYRVQNRAQNEIKGVAFRDILDRIPRLLKHIPGFYENLNMTAAKSSDVTSLFKDVSMYPDIVDYRIQMADTEARLDAERSIIAKTLGQMHFSFATVGNHAYLIEVKNCQIDNVPRSWIKMSGTKQLSRFRSPEVESLLKTLAMLKEKHRQACDEAWISLLIKFNQHFFSSKEAIQLLASLDCYFSLANFARQDGFCRPQILPKHEKRIRIVGGRHPVLERILVGDRQYVANDTNLSVSRPCMVLTGPNMGGKSSYLRQVALLTLLAHLGAHIPAREAEISVLDGIYTRMGAKDQIMEHRSTFMVEMQETSEILEKATSHSLVILDELGRGTSTHDGCAIAYATLDYLMTKIRCLSLFVTHYLPLTEVKVCSGDLTNAHMSFVLNEDTKEEELLQTTEASLTFLYMLKEGVADGSYGTNVGRLAGLPSSVLHAAHLWSRTMRSQAHQKRLRYEWLQKLMKTKSTVVIKKFIQEWTLDK